jgi:hypothetical protein
VNTKEILIRGKQKILERGWCQHMSIAPDGRCCMIGALALAAERFDGADYPARRVLENVIGPVWSIPSFNDAPGRTKEEVLEVFDKAITLAGSP